jgi:hypothetical protein
MGKEKRPVRTGPVMNMITWVMFDFNLDQNVQPEASKTSGMEPMGI